MHFVRHTCSLHLMAWTVLGACPDKACTNTKEWPPGLKPPSGAPDKGHARLQRFIPSGDCIEGTLYWSVRWNRGSWCEEWPPADWVSFVVLTPDIFVLLVLLCILYMYHSLELMFIPARHIHNSSLPDIHPHITCTQTSDMVAQCTCQHLSHTHHHHHHHRHSQCRIPTDESHILHNHHFRW